MEYDVVFKNGNRILVPLEVVKSKDYLTIVNEKAYWIDWEEVLFAIPKKIEG